MYYMPCVLHASHFYGALLEMRAIRAAPLIASALLCKCVNLFWLTVVDDRINLFREMCSTAHGPQTPRWRISRGFSLDYKFIIWYFKCSHTHRHSRRIDGSVRVHVFITSADIRKAHAIYSYIIMNSTTHLYIKHGLNLILKTIERLST